MESKYFKNFNCECSKKHYNALYDDMVSKFCPVDHVGFIHNTEYSIIGTLCDCL